MIRMTPGMCRALTRAATERPTTEAAMGKAAAKPKGSRKGNRHPRPVFDPAADGLPHGTLVAAGTVEGRAVPWKAPNLGRNGGVVHGRDYRRYVDWKEKIAAACRQDMGRRQPYGGPVELRVTFYVRPRGTQPDRSNLLKAFEDAIQGAVIQNDSQILAGATTLVLSKAEPQRVEWAVHALGRDSAESP